MEARSFRGCASAHPTAMSASQALLLRMSSLRHCVLTPGCMSSTYTQQQWASSIVSLSGHQEMPPIELPDSDEQDPGSAASLTDHPSTLLDATEGLVQPRMSRIQPIIILPSRLILGFLSISRESPASFRLVVSRRLSMMLLLRLCPRRW